MQKFFKTLSRPERNILWSLGFFGKVCSSSGTQNIARCHCHFEFLFFRTDQCYIYFSTRLLSVEGTDVSEQHLPFSVLFL